MGLFSGFFNVNRNLSSATNFIGRGVGDVFEEAKSLIGTGDSRAGNKQKQDIKKRAKLNADNKDLIKAVTDDQEISEITRAELLGQLGKIGTSFEDNSALFDPARKKFEAAKLAKEGSIFASRQGTEERIKILKDQPGRSQFVSNRKSLLGR